MMRTVVSTFLLCSAQVLAGGSSNTNYSQQEADAVSTDTQMQVSAYWGASAINSYTDTLHILCYSFTENTVAPCDSSGPSIVIPPGYIFATSGSGGRVYCYGPSTDLTVDCTTPEALEPIDIPSGYSLIGSYQVDTLSSGHVTYFCRDNQTFATYDCDLVLKNSAKPDPADAIETPPGEVIASITAYNIPSGAGSCSGGATTTSHYYISVADAKRLRQAMLSAVSSR